MNCNMLTEGWKTFYNINQSGKYSYIIFRNTSKTNNKEIPSLKYYPAFPRTLIWNETKSINSVPENNFLIKLKIMYLIKPR